MSTEIVIDISDFKDGQVPRWDTNKQKFVPADTVDPDISYRNPSWIGALDVRRITGVSNLVDRIVKGYIGNGITISGGGGGGFGTVAAGTFLGGPTSGADAVSSFRKIVSSDLPSTIAYINGTIAFTTGQQFPSVSIGTTPSTTGDLRLKSGFAIEARNNANNADLYVLRTDSSDQILIGGNTWTNTSGTRSGVLKSTTFAPTSGSFKMAGVQLNPTINATGTVSGAAYTSLAIATKLTSATGTTVTLLDIGTTTTDYFTGYSSKFSVDTSGNTIAVGSIKSSSPTTGIGYTAGAGGTIKQLTSKATGVTLNKITGQITTFNNALAGGAIVTFAFTNAAIATKDQLLINVVSGEATPGSYRAWASQLTNGSCNINIKNETGGSLSEAIVLGYSVIKGDDGIITTGILGYWKFDESSGTLVNDSSGNNYNGSYVNSPIPNSNVPPNITFPDPFSITFSQSASSHVEIPNFTFPTAAFTVTWWLNLTDSGSSGFADWFDTQTDPGTSGVSAYFSHTDTHPRISFKFGDGTTLHDGVLVNSNIGSYGTWIHAAITWDGSFYRLYVNGTLTTTSAPGLPAPATINQKLFLGSSNISAAINGSLDDFRIYNRGLSASEITDIASGAR